MKKFLSFAWFIVALSAFAQNGLHLDGNNDYVQSTYTGISGSNNRTVEAWIKVPYYQFQKVIVDWGSMNLTQRFTLNLIAGKLRCEIGGSGSTGTTLVGDNQWHHVAVTYDHTATFKYKLYVDGLFEKQFNLSGKL